MITSMSHEERFAHRVSGMEGSAIRAMLKVAGKPGFISLGGGLPAPESFPAEIITNLQSLVRDKYGPNLYQYGKTEGFDALVGALPAFLSRPNRAVISSPETIAITSGSQEALHIIGMMFIDPGTKVAVESPTYLGALQAFSAFEPVYVDVPTDRDGIIPDEFERLLTEQPDIRFLYTIPTFQNPSGFCMPLERRQRLAAILKEHDMLAVEDDPYSELRYNGEPLPSLQSLAPDQVVHLFTFSKTLAPDFRIGGMVAPRPIRDKAVLIKQGADLYTSNQLQAIVSEYLLGRHVDSHILKIISLYRPRRDAMVAAIEKYFPDVFASNRPDGGMFLFSQLRPGEAVPEGFKLEDVFNAAVEQNVGFVSGLPFYAHPESAGVSMRLNFTNQTESNIERGIEVIGNELKARLHK